MNIHDIAKLAGVSKSTVSRAISKNGYVATESLQRILQVMEEVNYRPNMFAKGMRTNRSYSIGILFPDLSNPFFPEWYHVVEQISGSKGYLNYICITDPYGESELKRIDDLLARSIDGIIYFSYQKNPKVLNKLKSISKHTPVICCDGMMIGEDLSYVCADDRKGTSKATRLLIESGRKRIAYIKGTDAYQIGLNRFEGYKTALAESNMQMEESLIFSGNFKMDDGFEAARIFMQQQNPPDAIMAATDFMAMGALNYLNEHGISVPERVGVIGFDNLARSAETNPPLTTIKLPLEQLAANAIEALIFQIENDKTIIQQVFDCEFIIRQSS
jgi:DNA-binding LacI/PurR family transcriptional regulator